MNFSKSTRTSVRFRTFENISPTYMSLPVIPTSRRGIHFALR